MQLSSVEDRLALFVEGMLGYYLHLRPRDAFDGTAELGSFSSQAAATLYLPAELPEGTAESYRVLAMRQVAQRLYGSFEFRLEPLLTLQPDLGDQADDSPSLRLGELERLRTRYRYPRLFQALFEALEAIRVDARTVADFPGLRRLLLAQLERSKNLLLDPELDVAPLLEGQLLSWCEAHWSALAGEPPATSSTAELVAAQHTPDADVYRSVLLADRCYKALPLEALDATLAELPPGTPPEPELTEQGQTSSDWLERDARLKDWQDELGSARRHAAGSGPAPRRRCRRGPAVRPWWKHKA